MTKVPGFSLIELVLAFGIFAMLATTTTLILTATLRSSAQATISAKVRNEGEYLMESVSQLVRYSPQVNCNTATGALNIQASPLPPLASITCSGTSLASNSAQLNSAEVEISGCAFTCSPSSTNPSEVNVSFTVQDTRHLVTPLVFDTNIVLRNSQ